MPAYEITIEHRTYAGHYHTQANAVFGAMRFRENELHRECYEGLPPWSERSEAQMAIAARRHRKVRTQLESLTRITIRPAPNKTPKKIHRVFPHA